jgi:hypothetical protein
MAADRSNEPLTDAEKQIFGANAKRRPDGSIIETGIGSAANLHEQPSLDSAIPWFSTRSGRSMRVPISRSLRRRNESSGWTAAVVHGRRHPDRSHACSTCEQFIRSPSARNDLEYH